MDERSLPHIYVDCVLGRTTKVHYLHIDDNNTSTYRTVEQIIAALHDAGFTEAILHTSEDEYLITVVPTTTETDPTHGEN